MARFVMETKIVSVQRIKIEDKVYPKIFVCEDADGESEAVTAVMTMGIRDEFVDEVFAAAVGLKLGDLVRLTVETERGSKQTTKNTVLHLEPVQSRPVQPNQPGQVNKPAEPAKA